MSAAMFDRAREALTGTSVDIDRLNSALGLTRESDEWAIVALAAAAQAPLLERFARLESALQRVEALLDRVDAGAAAADARIERATQSAVERIALASLAKPWHYIIIVLLAITTVIGFVK
jgi:predicted dinucleotide-utilizing enzyme